MVQGEVQNVKSTRRSRLKYEVAISSSFGRYLVASKDLVAGEVILQENPLTVGPAVFYRDQPCFNCLKPLASETANHAYCSKCNVVPLCESRCELTQGYHDITECRFLKANKICKFEIVNHHQILLPLRLWLLKESQPDIWMKINKMEDHVKERRGTSVWTDRDESIVQVLMRLKLVPNDQETSDIIQRLCGILDVNSFELRAKDGSELHVLRGIYTNAALMAHDCRGNTHLTVDDKYQLTVIASVPIPAGETIFFNYTGSFLGTPERREHLRIGKYFECNCLLCKDPFELESHLSSLVCPRCRRGFVAVQEPLTKEPYASKTKWQCASCKCVLSGIMVKTTLNLIRNLIEDSAGFNTKGLELLLTKLQFTLHTNHHFSLEIKQKLLAAYKAEFSVNNPYKRSLQRAVSLCKEILDVMEITTPGISRLKGIVLYEMHLPMIRLAHKEFTAHEISPLELASKLESAEFYLRKALSMLLLEPPTTPEGQLAKQAMCALKLLMQNIGDVKALPLDESKQCTKLQKKTKKSNHMNKLK